MLVNLPNEMSQRLFYSENNSHKQWIYEDIENQTLIVFEIYKGFYIKNNQHQVNWFFFDNICDNDSLKEININTLKKSKKVLKETLYKIGKDSYFYLDTDGKSFTLIKKNDLYQGYSQEFHRFLSSKYLDKIIQKEEPLKFLTFRDPKIRNFIKSKVQAC